MNDIHAEHITITETVKQMITPLKVVFPAQYGRMYAEVASGRNVELSPNEMLTREMLDEKMVRHVITLAECTDRAIEAIEGEDKVALKAILLKTKQLQEEIRELQKIVYEDSLTKSYNRKWFDDTLLEHDTLRLRGSGTIVMIDLNKFKEINDNYGHVVGDKVLMHIAAKLKKTGGRVVRYGGDEFLVIFDEGITFAEIREQIDKVLRYFGRIHFKTDVQSFKIGFAYGMATFNPESTIDQVIEEADRAMYRHKHSA